MRKSSKLLLIVLAIAVPVYAGTGPDITFTETSHDFGTVNEGDILDCDFIFKNSGDQILLVTDVKTSCGCTAIKDWNKSVEPGDTGKIHISFTSKGYYGKISKNITVECNDPGNPTANLTVEGTVTIVIKVEPTTASFGIMNQGQPQTRVIRITNMAINPLQINTMNSTNPVFAPELKAIRDGQEYELTITANPNVASGISNGTIWLVTSNPLKPKIEINANCYVPEPLEIMPRMITLPAGTQAKESRKTVYVANFGQTPIQIQKVTIDRPEIKTGVSVTTEGSQYQVTLDFPAGFTLAENETVNLKLEIKNSSLSVFHIPIVAEKNK